MNNVINRDIFLLIMNISSRIFFQKNFCVSSIEYEMFVFCLLSFIIAVIYISTIL